MQRTVAPDPRSTTLFRLQLRDSVPSRPRERYISATRRRVVERCAVVRVVDVVRPVGRRFLGHLVVRGRSATAPRRDSYADRSRNSRLNRIVLIRDAIILFVRDRTAAACRRRMTVAVRLDVF